MGNLYSNLSEEAKQFKELTGDSEQGTPVSGRSSTGSGSNADGENNALLKVKGVPFDPRSPTQGVNRTPLEIQERNRRIEKARITNLFNKENNLTVPAAGAPEEEEMKTPTGPLTKDGLPLFDPRSPGNPEINRTPIAFDSNTPVGRKLLHNQRQN